MRGLKQYEKFKAGKSLTRHEAILAQCYLCNGEDEGGVDCVTVSCPLYGFMPYRKGRVKKQLSPARKAMAMEGLRKARESTILPPVA